MHEQGGRRKYTSRQKCLLFGALDGHFKDFAAMAKCGDLLTICPQLMTKYILTKEMLEIVRDLSNLVLLF